MATCFANTVSDTRYYKLAEFDYALDSNLHLVFVLTRLTPGDIARPKCNAICTVCFRADASTGKYNPSYTSFSGLSVDNLKIDLSNYIFLMADDSARRMLIYTKTYSVYDGWKIEVLTPVNMVGSIIRKYTLISYTNGTQGEINEPSNGVKIPLICENSNLLPDSYNNAGYFTFTNCTYEAGGYYRIGKMILINIRVNVQTVGEVIIAGFPAQAISGLNTIPITTNQVGCTGYFRNTDNAIVCANGKAGTLLLNVTYIAK